MVPFQKAPSLLSRISNRRNRPGIDSGCVDITQILQYYVSIEVFF